MRLAALVFPEYASINPAFLSLVIGIDENLNELVDIDQKGKEVKHKLRDLEL